MNKIKNLTLISIFKNIKSKGYTHNFVVVVFLISNKYFNFFQTRIALPLCLSLSKTYYILKKNEKSRKESPWLPLVFLDHYIFYLVRSAIL